MRSIITCVIFANVSNSSDCDVEAGKEFLHDLMSPEKAIDQSEVVLSEYFPSMPERASVVRSRIDEADIRGDDEHLYTAYAAAVVVTKQELFKNRRVPDRVRSLLNAPGLFILNIINKLLVSRSAVFNAAGDCPEFREIDKILFELFMKISDEDKTFGKGLRKAMRKLHHIESHVRENDWTLDNKLKLIPRIAHNVVEYLTITSLVLHVSDESGAFGILDQLYRLAVLQGGTSDVAGLRSLLGQVDEAVALLRFEAENMIENDDISHSFLISNIVTALANIF